MRHLESVARTVPAARSDARLWAEFCALYLAAPVLFALFLPPDWILLAFFPFTLVALFLLWRTDGFEWRELVRGWSRIDWRLAVFLTAVAALGGLAVIRLTSPGSMFGLYRHDRQLFVLVMCLYPFLSALPQELIYRPLFFRRYGRLLPGGLAAIVVNAAVFSLAHLMYWSWIALLSTFVGGLVFAVSYRRRGFPEVWLLHALAGNALFAVGMGAYFYSGNVVRPF